MAMDAAEMVLWLGYFFYKSKITKDLFAELLDFIGQVTERKHKALNSFHMFEKYLESLAPLEKMDPYVYCPACKIPRKKAEWQGCDDCSGYKNPVKLINQGYYFVMGSLETALRNLLEFRENECAILNYRAKMNSTPSSSYRDIMDTRPYQEIIRKFQGSCGQNIPFVTLAINLDAAEKFKSSKSSVYPLMIAVNELPPILRGSNLIVPFVFQRDDDNDFDDRFLAPFIEELNKLSAEGFNWLSSISGTNQTTHVIPFCYVMDAMMKPKLLGITHPTGYNSCPSCFVIGEWVQKGKGGSVIFLSTDAGSLEKRTEDNLIVDSRGQVFIPALLSVKGNRDLYRMVPVDPMHNVYLGNTKYLIKKIFDKTAKGKANQNAANEILENTRPTDFIERGPRKFTEVAFWKAHEWANFLFYYSLPIFEELNERGLITHAVVDHWASLIEGIALINSREVSPDDIVKSGRLLQSYHAKMPLVHSQSYCTYNLHTMTHMAENVSEHGPAWASSMFMYETFNSMVLESSNGTQFVPLQIAERLSWKRPLQLLQQKVEQIHPNSFSVEQTLFKRSHSGIHLKKKRIKPLTQLEQTLFLEHFGNNTQNLVVYDAVIYNGVDYTTWSHDTRRGAARKVNCYIFHTPGQRYGQIKSIIVENNHTVLLLFNEIVGEPCLVRHGIKNTECTKNLIIERVLDHCIIKCIKITNSVSSYVFQKINECKGS